jgi:hypothetical protein
LGVPVKVINYSLLTTAAHGFSFIRIGQEEFNRLGDLPDISGIYEYGAAHAVQQIPPEREIRRDNRKARTHVLEDFYR